MTGAIVTVRFHEEELFGFTREDGDVFVALRPMVEAMGLDWSGQLQRLRRDPILSEGVGVMPTPRGYGAGQEVVCLRLGLVNGWLFTIDAARIRDEEVKARVLMYQRECYDVLHRYFAKGAQPEASSELTLGEKRQLVTEARQTFDARTARVLWVKLGLPLVPTMLAPEQPELPLPEGDREAA